MTKNKKKTNNKQLISNEGFYTLLLRWFTWQKVGVILTGLGIMVSIIIFLLSKEERRSEVEIIKERITENISTIQSTFQPEKIPVALDSLPDVKMIRDFKEKTLKASALWESIENIEPYSYHLKHGKHQVEFVWERNMERDKNRDSLYLQIEKIVCELQAYASDHDLEECKLINYSKLFKSRELIVEKSKMYKQTVEEYVRYTEKGDLEKAYHAIDVLKSKPEYYAFDETFFEFLVDANKAYDKSLARYLDKVTE